MMKILTNKNKVKCYCNNQRTANLFPITKTNSAVPDWLKNIKHDFTKCQQLGITSNSVRMKTMKSCAGIRDLFSQSYMLRLWSDLEIYIDKDKEYITWYFADTESKLVIHNPYQRGDFLSKEEYIIAKIHSPWFIKSNRDINWSIIPPIYHDENQRNKIYTLPGLLNFKYQHTLNIFLALKNTTGSHLIQAGTPLMYMVPQTERKLDLTTEYNLKEYEKLSNFDEPFTFERSYFKKRRQLRNKENSI